MINLRHTKTAAGILALGVVLGAFGAHSLKAILTEAQIESWKTAVLYLFIHGIGMLIISVADLGDDNGQITKQSFYLFLVGIFCFSGSIFLLTLQETLNVKLGWLGPITPLGGLLFILGWANLMRLTSLTVAH